MLIVVGLPVLIYAPIITFLAFSAQYTVEPHRRMSSYWSFITVKIGVLHVFPGYSDPLFADKV